MTDSSRGSPSPSHRSQLGAAFDEFAPDLLRFSARVSSPGVDPADIVQSTFLRATELSGRFDANRRHLPWLISIAKRVAHEERRRVSRRPTALSATTVAETPIESAQNSELVAAVADAIAELPSAYRRTVAQHLLSGLTVGEIAASESLPVGTVKSRLHRGLERIRQLLPPGFAAVVLTQLAAPLAATRAACVGSTAAAAGLAATSTSATGRWAVRTGPMNYAAVACVLLLVIVLPTAWLFGGTGSTGPAAPIADAEAVEGTAAVASASTAESAAPSRRRRVTAEDTPRALGRLVGPGIEAAMTEGGPAHVHAYRSDTVSLLTTHELLAMPPGSLPRVVADARRAFVDADPMSSVAVESVREITVALPTGERSWVWLEHDFVALVIPAPAPAGGGDLGALPAYVGGVVHGREPALAGRTLELVATTGGDAPTSAEVQLSLAAAGGRLVTRVDAGGTYRFTGVWPGVELTVRGVADGSGFAASVPPLRPTEIRHVALPRIRLATLGVRVIDADGDAVPSADVMLSQAGDAWPSDFTRATTDTSGRAELRGLFAGEVRVLATGPSLAPVGESIRLRPGHQELVCRLGAQVQAEGRVVDPDGRPVAGAVVTLRKVASMMPTEGSCAPARDAIDFDGVGDMPTFVLARGTTDAEGRFAIHARHVPSSVRIAPPPDRATALASVERSADRAMEVALPLQSRARIRVLAAAAGSMPAHARVAWCARSDGTFLLRAEMRAVAPDGTLELGSIPFDARAVAISTPSAGRAVAALPTQPRLDVDLGEVVLAQPSRRRGRVLGRDGAPAASARVTWTLAESPMSMPIGVAWTDPDGHFDMAVPDAALVQMHAEHHDSVARAAFRAGRETVPELQLLPAARIHGRCSDRSAITLVDLERGTPRVAQPALDGTFAFEPLHPGRYLIAAGTNPLDFVGVQRITVEPGGDHAVSFADAPIESGAVERVTVRVLGAGAPTSSWMLVVGRADEAAVPRVAALGEDGVAEIDWPSGPTRLAVVDASGAMRGVPRTFDHPPAREVILEVGIGAITGRFDGEAPPGTPACVYRVDEQLPGRREAQWTMLGDRGSFHFAGLPNGVYRVLVLGAGCAGSATIRLDAPLAVCDIEAQPTGRIELEFLDAREPCTPFELSITTDGVELPVPPGESWSRPRHGLQNRAVLALPAGTYSVSPRGAGLAEVSVTAVAGRTSHAAVSRHRADGEPR